MKPKSNHPTKAKPQPQTETQGEHEPQPTEQAKARRLVSISTLRSLPGMRGLTAGSDAFRAKAIEHLTAWVNDYRPGNAKPVKLDPEVRAAVYRAFKAEGEGKRIPKDLLFVEVFKLLSDKGDKDYWRQNTTALRSQIDRVVAGNSDFAVIRGPAGGTAWKGSTDHKAQP